MERRKYPLRRFTHNSLKGRERSISYIYCERLNRLLRNLNDLTTTTGVRRGKSKGGTLSKRLEKPHSRPEQNLDLQLLASLKKVACWKIFQGSPALAIALNFRRKGGNALQIRAFIDPFVPSGEGGAEQGVRLDWEPDSFSYRTHLPFDSKVETLPPVRMELLVHSPLNPKSPNPPV